MINFTPKKKGWNLVFNVDATYSRNFKIAQINLERNNQEERFKKLKGAFRPLIDLNINPYSQR